MSGLALTFSAAGRPPQEQNQHPSVTHRKGLKTRKTWKWISLPNSYASFPLKATKMRAHSLLPSSHRHPSFHPSRVTGPPGSILSATAYPWEKVVERHRVTWLLKTVSATRMKYTALQQKGHPADPLTSESQLKTEGNLVTPSVAPVTVKYVCKTVGGCMESLQSIRCEQQNWEGVGTCKASGAGVRCKCNQNRLYAAYMKFSKN